MDAGFLAPSPSPEGLCECGNITGILAAVLFQNVYICNVVYNVYANGNATTLMYCYGKDYVPITGIRRVSDILL